MSQVFVDGVRGAEGLRVEIWVTGRVSCSSMHSRRASGPLLVKNEASPARKAEGTLNSLSCRQVCTKAQGVAVS